jgi:hypothetical protein
VPASGRQAYPGPISEIQKIELVVPAMVRHNSATRQLGARTLQLQQRAPGLRRSPALLFLSGVGVHAGHIMVSKLEEFRQSAADCRQMAAVAPSEFAKQHWLETTAHWMKMAAAEEGAMGTTRPGQLGRSLEHPHNNISGATTTAAAMKAKATAPRCSRRVTAARLC